MRNKCRRGYLYDILGLFLAVVVLLTIFYLWFTVSDSMVAVFGDADVTAFKNTFDAQLTQFDSNLPYFFGLLMGAVVVAFAALNINRFVVFIFAALLISLGLFMQFAEPQLATMVLLFGITEMPNLMYIIGQLKLIMFVMGLVMLAVGFIKGAR